MNLVFSRRRVQLVSAALVTFVASSVLSIPASAQTADEEIFRDENSTSRFLTQATFGPKPSEVERLVKSSASSWFETQLNQPQSLTMPILLGFRESTKNPITKFDRISHNGATIAFWRNAMTAPDQLR